MNNNLQNTENDPPKSKVRQMIHRFFQSQFFRKEDKTWTWWGAFSVALAFTVLLGGILALAIYWMVERVDAPIRAELTSAQFSFVTKKDIRLSSIKFQSIQINEFDNITLYPLPLENSDNSQLLEGVSEMNIIPEEGEVHAANIFMKNVNDEHCGKYAPPMITMPEADNKQLYNHYLSVMSFFKTLERKPCGKLDGFIIPKGSRVTLQANPYNLGELNVIVTKTKEPLEVLISFKEPFQLTTAFSQIMADDAKLPIAVQDTTLTMILDEDEDPYVTITSQPERLELRLSIFPRAPFFIFSESDINFPIETPKVFVTDDTPEGTPIQRSSLLTEGKMSYTDYPNIKPVYFKESDIIRFGKGGDFKMERIRFVPRQKEGSGGIEVRLRGTPQKFTINESVENKQDRRLTRYEILKENKFWQIAIDYVAWAIPLIIGIMGLLLIEEVKIRR